VGPKVQIRECLLSHLQGVRTSSKQASMTVSLWRSRAAGGPCCCTRRGRRQTGRASRSSVVRARPGRHRRWYDAVDSVNGFFFFLFANCYGWAMGLAWFITAAAQVELSRSCQLTQKSTFFFFCLLSANSMLRGTTPGATGRSESQRGPM
jgi:hypothetical protein